MADAAQGVIRSPLGIFQQSLAQNEKGEQLIAAGLPRGAEGVRKGSAWAVMSTTAVAGLVVRPSTTAAFELWNGYPNTSAGKSLIIDQVFAFNLVSTNVVEGFSLWAQVTTAKAAPSTDSLTVRGSSGKSYGGPNIAARSTTVIDSGWFPWTNAYQKGAGGVVPFGAVLGEVDGRLIVPPGSSLCLHMVSSLVGQTFTFGARWYEEYLSIE